MQINCRKKRFAAFLAREQTKHRHRVGVAIPHGERRR
jgi:hypothetical protein